MTVSYQYDVASSSTGGFFRLLWRWRGSIWKLLYKELLLFLCVYICIAFTYDFLMTDYYKKYYEHIVVFCSAFVEVIPLSFILGFYVSFTAHRWWQQYTAIPWPDKLMNIIALYIPGNDVTSRVLRRTLMRYLNLTLVLVLRSISIPVKRRFPTKEHLVEAGFMSRPELEIYQSVPSHEFNTFWIPCTWFVNLLREAKSECRITDSGGIKLIMEEFNEFRSKCGLLWSYDWVSIPLVYTQVVTLSTQAFFLASLLGRQHINPSEEIKSHIYGEYYIPIFTMLQFILYMGLLKLGEQLINPFGDDDEDFELNWIIDRHLKVSFLGVDILNSDPPPLIKDNYFDDTDIKLPYTEAAVAHKVKTYRGSVAAFHVPTEKHGLVIPEFEDDYEEDSDDEPSTAQSNRDAVARTNSWSLFNQRKRKLSSSFDSFNSETMVETAGLSESEIPELVPTNSSWPMFLKSEQEQEQQQQSSSTSLSKLSVWPMNKFNHHQMMNNNEKANEDTQGIRCRSEIDGQTTTKSSRPYSPNDNNQQSKTISDGFKQQSSFSTSDSSIVIPMGETTDQSTFSSADTAKYFKSRKYPLQVFSKELANAPISVFNQIFESNLRRESKNSTDRISLSSIVSSRNVERSSSFKPHKSLIKCQRAVDPKLRIRPFRSKVTFSDDTKTGDNSRLRIDRYQNNYDSSSESNSSLKKDDPTSSRPTKRTHLKPRILLDPNPKTAQSAPDSFLENRKRRQSFDPAIYREKTNIGEEAEKDNWLHYQSLPNIQEEDQNHTHLSSLESQQPVSADFTKIDLKLLKTSLEIHCPIEQQSISQPSASPQTSSSLSPPPEPPPPIPSERPSPVMEQSQTQLPAITTNKVLLSPQSSIASNSSGSEPSRKRSFKRQKSQEIPDEDLKIRLSQPPTRMIKPIIKQSSDESQASSSNSTSVRGILRKRKEDLKQASTESDTGSYHTVRSFNIGASSSIDSFTSAVSDPTNTANSTTTSVTANNNNNSNGNSSTGHHQEDKTTLSEKRLLSFPTIESTLVPKIVFSQSTPSVTSQSSDDQNSPKWDERYSEFSSMETVTDSTLIRPSNNNNNNNDNRTINDRPITLSKSNNINRSSQVATTTTTTTTTSSSIKSTSTAAMKGSQSINR